jgi:mono/diheme cytochrome c family protein
VVLNGKSPAMPAWRDKISDDDVKLLWAYVRSGGLDTAVSARAGWILKMDGEGAIP